MILVDYLGHLVSTESEEELHKFVLKLDITMGILSAEYMKDGYMEFKHPHYSLLGQSLLKEVIKHGAEQVSSKELVRRAWWNKE